MNPKVSKLLALIPERAARHASGTRFASGAGCPHPERVAALTQFLSWTTPLAALSREEQQRLGIATSASRPADAADEADDAEAEVEEPIA
jgi:hypothetical protein